MLFALFLLAASRKKKDEIQEMDGHRFRKVVFNRDLLDVWVSLLSSQDVAGHSQANNAFDEAFKLGKGFLKFAYCDSTKNVHIPRRLQLKKLPQFCVFHPGGQHCVEANISGRDLINIASGYLPDFTEQADSVWLRKDEQNSAAILFTDKKTTPSLWAAIATAFRRSLIRIGISRDHEFAKSLGVESFPAILLHNYSHNIVYEGENDFSNLKANLKKFMQKKLIRVRSLLKIRPVSEFETYCDNEDKICIVHATDSVNELLEKLRLKHSTGMFEFFFGKSDEQKDNTVMVKWPGQRKYIEVDDINNLEPVIEQILNKTASWNELPEEPEDEEVDEDDAEL